MMIATVNIAIKVVKAQQVTKLVEYHFLVYQLILKLSLCNIL